MSYLRLTSLSVPDVAAQFLDIFKSDKSCGSPFDSLSVPHCRNLLTASMVSLRLSNSISGASLDHYIEFMMEFIPKKDSPPRITCRYRKCPASFSRKTDARRHETQVHQPAKIFCKFSGCRFRGTVRAEVMRRHLKSKHPFDGKFSSLSTSKPF